MNRREFVNKSTSVAVGSLISSNGPVELIAQQTTLAKQSQSPALPSIIAGVRIVDSQIARTATDLSWSVSPPYLFNHAVRTYVFGSLIGRALGQTFDEEVLYLSCILHDLGLTTRFQGDLPFEIQGAQAAKHFLDEHAYSKEKSGIVWDGIAMHASPIGYFKQAEIMLVGEGAGADVVGPDPSQVSKAMIAQVLGSLPRLGFKNAFLKTCADVVRKYPGGATRSFMRDIGERYVPEFHPRNFCDHVVHAPFPE